MQAPWNLLEVCEVVCEVDPGVFPAKVYASDEQSVDGCLVIPSTLAMQKRQPVSAQNRSFEGLSLRTPFAKSEFEEGCAAKRQADKRFLPSAHLPTQTWAYCVWNLCAHHLLLSLAIGTDRPTPARRVFIKAWLRQMTIA